MATKLTGKDIYLLDNKIERYLRDQTDNWFGKITNEAKAKFVKLPTHSYTNWRLGRNNVSSYQIQRILLQKKVIT